MEILKKHFPELCAELGAHVFYKMYRNGIVHDFTLERGYAIANNDEVNGAFIDQFKVKDRETVYVALNIDRLKDEYVQLVDSWRWEDSGDGDS